MEIKKYKHRFFERFSAKATTATGSTAAFLLALGLVVVWGATGPIFHYSETWQLVINTGTTIITFLMVFLIQKSQNRDSVALQMKLNELIAATEAASNRLIDAEDLSEEELKLIHSYYLTLKEKAIREDSLQKLHSVEEEETSEANRNLIQDKEKKVTILPNPQAGKENRA